MTDREIYTKDDVPLAELLDVAQTIIDVFNEAERPFRDLFVEQVDQAQFTQDLPGEMTWELLAEGEHPRTGDIGQPFNMAMSVEKYGRSLGFTQEFIEDHTSEQVTKRVRELVAGHTEREETVIKDTLDAGIADGSTLWYDVPDYGGYTHSRTHDHKFMSTDELFGTSGTAYEPREHIEEAADHLRHHGRYGPFVALCGQPLVRKIKNDLSWDASYHIPWDSNLRSVDVHDLDITIDGVRLVQTAYITGDEFYLTQVQNDQPLKYYEKRPVQLTSPNGGQVNFPGELIGASGSARYGVKMADPLGAVYVKGDNFA